MSFSWGFFCLCAQKSFEELNVMYWKCDSGQIFYQSLGLPSTPTVLITLSSICSIFSQDTLFVLFSILMAHNNFLCLIFPLSLLRKINITHCALIRMIEIVDFSTLYINFEDQISSWIIWEILQTSQEWKEVVLD